MKVFGYVVLIILFIGLFMAVFFEAVVIRNISDNHLNARSAIIDIGGFIVDPDSPDVAFEKFVEYDNLPAACGILILYLDNSSEPDMDFVQDSYDTLVDLADSIHNLELESTDKIDSEYLRGVLEDLNEVSGWY